MINQMLKRDEMDNLAELFGALASDTRIRILCELRERQLCVGALAMRLDLTQSAISQHLRVLRNAGLVESDKRGSHVHYSITDDALARCQRAVTIILAESEAEDRNGT